jgi:hypothetical protein
MAAYRPGIKLITSPFFGSVYRVIGASFLRDTGRSSFIGGGAGRLIPTNRFEIVGPIGSLAGPSRIDRHVRFVGRERMSPDTDPNFTRWYEDGGGV